jgi:hypothetical protein
MNKLLWVVAAVLLLLCLRVNAFRSVDGTLECLDPDYLKAASQTGCQTTRGWTVSLKFPWQRW